MFLSGAAEIDCGSTAADVERNLDGLAAGAIDVLHGLGVVAFRLGRLRLGKRESRELAHSISQRVCEHLIARGAPSFMRLEIDTTQTTDIPSGAPVRTRLPHFDGQHCSYLTPSLDDDPDFDPKMRVFSADRYTTTPAHKMYQGIFINEPGSALSVTTYYDWLRIIGDVRRLRRIAEVDAVETVAAARWLGANLRQGLEMQPQHGCSYPSLGAMLGLTEEAFHALPFASAEDFIDEDIARSYPVLRSMAHQCPCGTCDGETGRVFCHLLSNSVGMTWPGFRHRYEIAVPSGQYDLIFGHNLTMLHGGLAGAPDRLLEPLCLVVDDPVGEDYEQWLSASWRRTLPIDASH